MIAGFGVGICPLGCLGKEGLWAEAEWYSTAPAMYIVTALSIKVRQLRLDDLHPGSLPSCAEGHVNHHQAAWISGRAAIQVMLRRFHHQFKLN